MKPMQEMDTLVDPAPTNEPEQLATQLYPDQASADKIPTASDDFEESIPEASEDAYQIDESPEGVDAYQMNESAQGAEAYHMDESAQGADAYQMDESAGGQPTEESQPAKDREATCMDDKQVALAMKKAMQQDVSEANAKKRLARMMKPRVDGSYLLPKEVVDLYNNSAKRPELEAEFVRSGLDKAVMGDNG